MKTTLKNNNFRVYMTLIVTSILITFASCSQDEPGIKASAIIKPTIVEINTATIIATIQSNFSSTNVSVDYKIIDTDHWQTQTLTEKIKVKDSTTVKIKLPNLLANTEYCFKIKTNNQAGELISKIDTFTTYALVDYDGNFYHTVSVGEQIWLKENLKTTHYANGDPIAQVSDWSAWIKLKTGAYCWYKNDIEAKKTYGALYNWQVVNDSRELIAGWHVPSNKEWDKLVNYLGGDTVAGPKIMVTGKVWQKIKVSPNNSSGLSFLPAGYRDISSGDFYDAGNNTYFWSSSQNTDEVLIRRLFSIDSIFEQQGEGPGPGFSVRCIKN